MSNNPAPPALSVLIVDDDPDTLTLVGLILRQQGFQVDFASEGETAIEKLKNNVYDAMITDVIMPGIDGWELVRLVRSPDVIPGKDNRSLAIILNTALVSPSDQRDNLPLSEIDAYLGKPFSLGMVRTTILGAIEHRRQVIAKQS